MTPYSTAKTALCRFCRAELRFSFVDLGMQPLCESYVDADHLNSVEYFYPLHVWVCERCLLVQLEEYVRPEDIFTEYAYFSSYSDSWVQHAKDYVAMIVERLGLDDGSLVVELASNDGYLLQHFLPLNIRVLGVEPAANIAKVAVAKGVPTVTKFFGEETAQELVAEGEKADLIIGNNVLAQVPDLNDFVAGMARLLKPEGVLTLEFPHLLRLMKENQFDTIYHEHFSYFSLLSTEKIFEAHRLTIFDVETLPMHGGSLRVYGRHRDDDSKPTQDRVQKLRDLERNEGLHRIETYQSFAEQVKETKRNLLQLLIDVRRQGKTVVGYGAPGKGNTLLNYCGIRTDFLDFTVDRNPYKQGRFLPGTHIPISHPDRIRETRPDYVLILPWNFKEEIMSQISYIRDWGGQFIVPIPGARVY